MGRLIRTNLFSIIIQKANNLEMQQGLEKIDLFRKREVKASRFYR